eukprot:m.4744 g.4744  ORF g.4744 m.4744 type:complete len:379 (-) comp1938_c0_seq1:140-1276(-)
MAGSGPVPTLCVRLARMAAKRDVATVGIRPLLDCGELYDQRAVHLLLRVPDEQIARMLPKIKGTYFEDRMEFVGITADRRRFMLELGIIDTGLAKVDIRLHGRSRNSLCASGVHWMGNNMCLVNINAHRVAKDKYNKRQVSISLRVIVESFEEDTFTIGPHVSRAVHEAVWTTLIRPRNYRGYKASNAPKCLCCRKLERDNVPDSQSQHSQCASAAMPGTPVHSVFSQKSIEGSILGDVSSCFSPALMSTPLLRRTPPPTSFRSPLSELRRSNIVNFSPAVRTGGSDSCFFETSDIVRSQLRSSELVQVSEHDLLSPPAFSPSPRCKRGLDQAFEESHSGGLDTWGLDEPIVGDLLDPPITVDADLLDDIMPAKVMRS